MSKNDPAFPTSGQYRDLGLTKLEWFAGMALAGLVVDNPGESKETISRWAFDLAEAMLAEADRRSK